MNKRSPGELFADLLTLPNLGEVAVQMERLDPDFQDALVFGAKLKTFLEQLVKHPWMLSQLPGYDAQTKTLTIPDDFHLKVLGTLFLDVGRHVRVDSGRNTEPGRHYPNSIFFNSEFDGPTASAEPVLPKFVPYAERATTFKVRKAMGAKKIRGCRCGGGKHGRSSGCGCH